MESKDKADLIRQGLGLGSLTIITCVAFASGMNGALGGLVLGALCTYLGIKK